MKWRTAAPSRGRNEYHHKLAEDGDLASRKGKGQGLVYIDTEQFTVAEGYPRIVVYIEVCKDYQKTNLPLTNK